MEWSKTNLKICKYTIYDQHLSNVRQNWKKSYTRLQWKLDIKRSDITKYLI